MSKSQMLLRRFLAVLVLSLSTALVSSAHAEDSFPIIKKTGG